MTPAVKPKPGQSISAAAIVAQYWGADAPPWITALADECDRTSQAQVAKKIGRSPALINCVLKNTYKADLNAIQTRVETVLGCHFNCPVLGLIDGARCLHEQDQKYSPYNHIRVALFRACRTCPRRVQKGEGHD